MASKRTTKEILADARDTLRTAQLGLKDVVSADPERRVPGLRNLVVFGRAVTNVLQNLRSTEPTFDAWYAPFVAEMRADPLLRYFYQLRSEILKQGSVTTSRSSYFDDFDFQRDKHLWGNRPAQATAMFMGDRHGGAGWTVKLPNGTEESYYVKLPARVFQSEIILPDAPIEHRGAQLADNKLSTVGPAYIAYLAALVHAADEQFGSA